MIDLLVDQGQLLEHVSASVARARRTGRPVLVSQTDRVDEADALWFFDVARRLGHPAFYWEQRDQGFAIAGMGSSWSWERAGVGDRWTGVAQAWQELLANALIDGLDTLPGSGPTLLGGWSFDPQRSATSLWRAFPSSALFLPRLQLTHSRGSASVTQNVLVEPDTSPSDEVEKLAHLWQIAGALPPARSVDPGYLVREELLPAAQWKSLVAATVEQIRSGRLEKVAVARALRVLGGRPYDIGKVLQRLRTTQSSATIFAVARDSQSFVGATPEQLVGLRSGLVRASALAGTARRGSTPDEDAALGRQLFDSPKQRHEHAVVVDMLRAAFGEMCVDVHAPAAPRLHKLHNVQHLLTPVTGRLRPPATLLDLVALLHPTPAVGGIPRPEALAFLRDHEQLDRGWYAAPVGWYDARGEGDFAVALRSGLIEGNVATLFAGCGIVAGSDPDDEYAETELKFRTMLDALRPEGVNNAAG